MTKILIAVLQGFIIAAKIMKWIDVSWFVALLPLICYYSFNVLIVLYVIYKRAKEQERKINSPYRSKWQEKLEELQRRNKL